MWTDIIWWDACVLVLKAITGVTAQQICVSAVIDSFNSLPSCEPFWKCNRVLEVGYGTTIDGHDFQNFV